MKKYLRAIVCIGFSGIKCLSIKLFHLHTFRFSFLSILSPLTEIEVGRNAKLTLGRRLRTRSGTKIRVRSKAEIKIGDNTFLNHGCMITSHERIEIGSDCQLGPHVLIYDHDHDFRAKDGLKGSGYKTSPVIIGNNVWIGANVVILRGTIIGDNCVIGAGSVVKGSFPPNSLIIQKQELVTTAIIKDV